MPWVSVNKCSLHLVDRLLLDNLVVHLRSLVNNLKEVDIRALLKKRLKVAVIRLIVCTLPTFLFSDILTKVEVLRVTLF